MDLGVLPRQLFSEAVGGGLTSLHVSANSLSSLPSHIQLLTALQVRLFDPLIRNVL